MITVFTCALVLVMMAVVLSYLARAQTAEQRMSANEVRQKQAFHAAEAGLRLASEWFLANNVLIDADVEEMLGSGLDGWLITGSPRWQLCGDVDYASDKSHPCWGDPVDQRRDDNFFYFWEGSTELPIDATGHLGVGNAQVRVEALLCLIDLDLDVLPPLTSPIRGCLTNPALVDSSKFVVTLLARGEADCSGSGCLAEARVSEQVSNFSIVAAAKMPGVPLATNSPLPTTGILELVANPDGGGPSLPLSLWGTANAACSGQSPISLDGSSLISCDPLSWGGLDALTGGLLGCGLTECACGVLDALTLTTGLLDIPGPDLSFDPDFPCDLLGFYFGVGRDQYEQIRDSVTVIDDCSSLNEESFGAYWVTGASCEIAANTVVGSADHPVMLISAASQMQLNSGSEIYGTLFLTDVEDAEARLVTTGDSTIYGNLVADGVTSELAGTFQVVYSDDIVADVSAVGGLGSITGSWTDFHKEWK